MTDGERAQIRAEAVRECIAALPSIWGNYAGMPVYTSDARVALAVLLPKTDPAKELVGRWMGEADWQDLGVTIAVEEYTAWLIDTGWLAP